MARIGQKIRMKNLHVGVMNALLLIAKRRGVINPFFGRVSEGRLNS